MRRKRGKPRTATALIVQLEQFPMNCCSHGTPIAGSTWSPLVTAGEMSFADPLRGSMTVFQYAAATEGVMSAWAARSGSLNLRTG